MRRRAQRNIYHDILLTDPQIRTPHRVGLPCTDHGVPDSYRAVRDANSRGSARIRSTRLHQPASYPNALQTIIQPGT